MRARAAGLVLGHLADRALGDPAHLHPVAGFGTVARRLERSGYGDSRARGVLHVALLAGGAGALGLAAETCARGPLARTAVTAAATWVVLGGRTLEREASAVAPRGDAARTSSWGRTSGKMSSTRNRCSSRYTM